jgi:hypothetical protein
MLMSATPEEGMWQVIMSISMIQLTLKNHFFLEDTLILIKNYHFPLRKSLKSDKEN